MDIRRRVTALLNGVVFLGSLYLGTTIGAGSWFMTGGLAIAALTLLNVVLLYHRVGGAAAYLLNGVLIVAGLWALLLNSLAAGFFESRDAADWVGMAAIAAAVVNLIPPSLYNGGD